MRDDRREPSRVRAGGSCHASACCCSWHTPPVHEGNHVPHEQEKPSIPQPVVRFMPPRVQAGGKRCCCQVPPLLSLQPYHPETRIYMETARSGPFLAVPHVDVTRCTGCGRCVAACPVRLVTLDLHGYRKTACIMAAERCTWCGACVESCPVGALATTAPEYVPGR